MNAGQQTDFFKMLLILITVNVMVIFIQGLYTDHMILSQGDDDIQNMLPGFSTFKWMDNQVKLFKKDNQDKKSWWNNNIIGSFMVGTWDILVNIGMFILLFFAIFFGFLGHAVIGTFTGEATVLMYIGTLIYLGVLLINIMYIRRMYNLLTGK